MRGFVKGLTNTYAVLNAVRGMGRGQLCWHDVGVVSWHAGTAGLPASVKQTQAIHRPECPVRTAAGRSE